MFEPQTKRMERYTHAPDVWRVVSINFIRTLYAIGDGRKPSARGFQLGHKLGADLSVLAATPFVDTNDVAAVIQANPSHTLWRVGITEVMGRAEK